MEEQSLYHLEFSYRATDYGIFRTKEVVYQADYPLVIFTELEAEEIALTLKIQLGAFDFTLIDMRSGELVLFTMNRLDMQGYWGYSPKPH